MPNASSSNIGILFNIGNGTFLPQITYATTSSPLHTVITDVNGDNIPDIVVTLSTTVGIFLNAGNGTFLPEISYATGVGPHYVAAVDVNGDNKPDLITTNYNSHTISVLLHV